MQRAECEELGPGEWRRRLKRRTSLAMMMMMMMMTKKKKNLNIIMNAAANSGFSYAAQPISTLSRIHGDDDDDSPDVAPAA